MRSFFLFFSRRNTLIVTLLGLLALGGFAYLHREDLDRESIIAYGQGMPAAMFFTAFLVLPLIGFPLSILLVLAGIRFGLAGGMAVAAAGIFFHNFAAYRLTHGWFRQRLRARLERAGYGIPAIKAKHQAWFTAVFAAISGPPYAAKLYALALTDVTFRIYFWVGSPVYIIFCLVPVGAGSAVTDFNPKLIAALIAIAAGFLIAGIALRRRFGSSLSS